MSLISELAELALEGLTTDGAHHKQWYLEKMLKLLTPNDYEKTKEEFNWDEGIPP
jgi:hypothetical protein